MDWTEEKPLHTSPFDVPPVLTEIFPNGDDPTTAMDVPPSLAPLDQEEAGAPSPLKNRKRKRQRCRPRDATDPDEEEQEIERRALTAPPPDGLQDPIATEAPKPQRPPRTLRRRNPRRSPSSNPEMEEPHAKTSPPPESSKNIQLYTEKLESSEDDPLMIQWRERKKLLELMEEGIPPSRVEFLAPPTLPPRHEEPEDLSTPNTPLPTHRKRQEGPALY